MFDPNIGQWLEEDPISFGGGDPNLRRYAGNDGTNQTDPSGLQGFDKKVKELLQKIDDKNKADAANLPALTIGKETLGRPFWRGVAAGFREMDWPLSTFLLRHSLQDMPDDLHFDSTSLESQYVFSHQGLQAAIKSIVREQIKNDPNGGKKGIFATGAVEFKFDAGASKIEQDLFAAIAGSKLLYHLNVSDGGEKWDIRVTVTDTYKFDLRLRAQYESSEKAVKDPSMGNIVRALGWAGNNAAWHDQNVGVIRPFKFSTSSGTISGNVADLAK